jgi:hypothetical protein
VHGLIKTIVQDYGWIHLSLGLAGNLMFVIGSVLFLPRFGAWQTTDVWLFIIGSALMMVRALGNLLVSLYEEKR